MVVIAKKDVPLRIDRARELYELAPVKKKLIEYDEEHFLDPQKYSKDILDWLSTEL